MHGFPFPHKERSRSFKITFLESVKLKVVYDPEMEDYAKFKDFFEGYTSLSLDKDRYETKKISSLRIVAEDGVTTLKFAKNFVEFSISGHSYTGFETNYKTFLEKLSLFLSSINSSASEISIEKINIWPMDIESGITDIKEVKDVIFSEEVQGIACDGNGIGIKEFKDSQNKVALLLKYGVLEQKDSELVLILDTKCVNLEEIQANKLLPEMGNLNQLLYDAYNWAVTEEVLDAMENPR